MLVSLHLETVREYRNHFLHLVELELKREEESCNASIPDEALLSQYYEYRQQFDQMVSDFREIITHPTHSLPYLKTGQCEVLETRLWLGNYD